MVMALKARGLYSIMAVKTRPYWPRGMPDDHILESLGEEFGSVATRVNVAEKVFLAALRDRKPKVVIANCSTTNPGSSLSRYIDGSRKTMRPPHVFDEYEENKGNEKDSIVICHKFTNTNIQEPWTLPTTGETIWRLSTT